MFRELQNTVINIHNSIVYYIIYDKCIYALVIESRYSCRVAPGFLVVQHQLVCKNPNGTHTVPKNHLGKHPPTQNNPLVVLALIYIHNELVYCMLLHCQSTLVMVQYIVYRDISSHDNHIITKAIS